MNLSQLPQRGLATPAEFGAHIQKPIQTLAAWRSKGLGPSYVKLENGHVRYRWESIESWIDGQVEGAA